MSEWDASDYAKNSTAQATWARELIAKLNLQGEESILDVGCGDGKITAELAQSVPQGHVLGIDGSHNMIDYAQTQYSTLPNLQFVQMDARQIVVDRPCDLVFSNAALHWVDDQPAFLKGAYQALKPSGQLVFSCGGRGNAAEFIAVFQQLQQQLPWQPYLANFQSPTYFHDDQDYLRWLLEAGFQPLSVALVPRDMPHEGKSGLAGWIRTTGTPYTHQMPEEDRDRFIDAFANAYLARYPLDSNGYSHVKMVRLEVEAIKP
jgi:trans-aconitate 2-methyltransferase